MSSLNAPIVKPEVVFIEELLEEIADGKLRVPRFQRPFVWKPSDMLALFDSIYKGYPIGSLLLWESGEKLESLENVGPLPIPTPSTTPLTYILDGHQRLATLFGGLRLPNDFSLSTKQENWKWWMWFNLKKREFTHVTKGRPDTWLLPLRAVLRTVDFLEVCRGLQEEDLADAKELIAEAERVAQKVKYYKVAITRIKGGSLEQAVEIFSRLNSLGRSMTPDQMVSALTYREGQEGIHLAEWIDAILDRLAVYHFGNVKRQTVLRAILAAADMDIHTSNWELLAKRLGKDDVLECAVRAVEKSLLAAGRYLYEELNVPGGTLLPYTNQILILSEFFHHCPDPDQKQKEILKKWFWATSLSGWFAGASTTQINNGIKEMRQLARNEITKLVVMPLDDPARQFPKNFDMRSARIRALLIFTLTLKPLDPITNQPLQADQILLEHGNRALPYVFPRVKGDLVSNPANRVLLKRVPGKSVKEQLCFIDPQSRRQVLLSHGISEEAYEALKRDDARGFIEARAKHLAHIEVKFMKEIGIRPSTETGFGEADIDAEET